MNKMDKLFLFFMFIETQKKRESNLNAAITL